MDAVADDASKSYRKPDDEAIR
ncbi:hypothetical protein EVAR_41131_1, partial [Eumeta japonica]